MRAPFFILILFFLSIVCFQVNSWALTNLELSQWHKLLHIENNRPLIKQKDFIHTLQPSGVVSVEDEITYWDKKFTTDSDHQSLCLFPARYWLWSKGKKNIPEKHCSTLNAFISEFDIQKVSLVFSSYYAQNSASLFGHTFLRFTRVNNAGQELLDWGISYSADMENINPVSMIYKSFFSTFPGSLQLMPYYYKVREYNDFEFRPLWSYSLKVNPEQIKFLLYHIWELSQIKVPYQYLTHNCSSLILDVLNIVKPEVDFRNNLAFYHIPIDTVKVLKRYDLIEEKVHYRPSLMQEWENKYDNLSQSEKKSFQQFISSLDNHYLTTEKLMDTALDFYDFKFGKELLTEGSAYQELKVKKNDLLIKRSKFVVTSYAAINPTEASPENVHPTRRVGFGFLTDDQDHQRLKMNYRFAYHDPIDPTTGMTSRMKINFMQPEISIDKHSNLRLEKLELLDIASWSYSPSLSHSLSYELSASWLRFVHKFNDQQTIQEISGTRFLVALGRTFDLTTNIYTSIMLEQQLTYSEDRENDWGLKIGPQWMLHFDQQDWRFRITAKKLYEVTGYQKYFAVLDDVEVMLNYSFKVNQVLSFAQSYNSNYNQSLLTWYYYY